MAVTGPAAVAAEGFGFRYAGRTEWAIRDAEFRIEPGERILLTGRSGSGKSTLLAAMAGLLGPDAGDMRGAVRVDGQPALRARDRIGVVFQDPDSQLVMSRAGDDVAFGLENRAVPADEIWPRVRAALDAVGFGYPLDRPTHALSGGEQQRLVLAGAIVARPGLLLLDEPTSQLDPAGAKLVREAVARILADRNTTLVLIDHDAEPWLPMVDRVLELPLLATQGRPDSVPATQGGPDSVHSTQGGPDSVPATQGGPDSVHSTQGGPDSVPATQGRPDSVHSTQGRPDSVHSTQGRPDSVQIGKTPASVLSAHRVGFIYPGESADRAALRPTDIQLHPGKVTAITGPNGSGKSTLGILLGGLKAPSTGRIVASTELAGRLADRPPHRWRARDLVHRIGTVFQNPEHQFLTGRVRDELSLGPLRAGAGDRAAHDRADELLDRLGLTAYADANPFTLSGGQQRRLSVAAALATRPSVLILDEPMFGQDRETWAELVRLLTEARNHGAALCLISHDTQLVATLADHELRLGDPRPSTHEDTPVDHRRLAGFPAAETPKNPAYSDDQLDPGRRT